MKNIRRFFVVGIIVLVAGCNTDDDPKPLEYYEESELLLNFSAQQIKDLFNFGGASALVAMVDYEIEVYKFYYKTTFKGEEITASGLLSIPITEDPVPIVSFQHGTIIAHDDAPSIDWPTYQQLTYFSSTGYIMAIPDFIGFGSSDDILHPYYVQEAYADAVIDMMKAAEEFFNLEGGNFNGDVFLAGYSEGGYATMATHKEMEDNPVEGLNLVASAPASGGYDLIGFRDYFFSLDTYEQPFFMAYVGAAYQNQYFQTSTLSDYFQEPYATNIPSLLDGSLNGDQVNTSLTQSVPELLQPGFIQGADTDPAYLEMKEALELNDLSNWLPTIPMYLYHGTADVTVPYFNSVQTYQNMVNLGAGPDVLTFTPLDGNTHFDGFGPYILDVIQLIDQLK